jgi:hypothetical protein
MREVIERPCAMPIEVETLRNDKYQIKLTVAGESDYLLRGEAERLFKALFKALDELDKRTDRKERKRA